MGDIKTGVPPALQPKTAELMQAERLEEVKRQAQKAARLNAMADHIEAELLKKSFTFAEFMEVRDIMDKRVHGVLSGLTFDEITKRYASSSHPR